MSLDRDCNNRGYVLGRVTAILEKYDQIGLIERNMRLIALNPSNLVKPHRHLIAKTSHKDHLEIGECLDKLAPDCLTKHFTLEEQNQFPIGYEHQQNAISA